MHLRTVEGCDALFLVDWKGRGLGIILPNARPSRVGVSGRYPVIPPIKLAGYLAAGVLFQSEVNTVLLGGGGKSPDVLIGDLDVGNAGVVLHQLPDGLLSVVQLGLVAGHALLHLVQHFFVMKTFLRKGATTQPARTAG